MFVEEEESTYDEMLPERERQYCGKKKRVHGEKIKGELIRQIVFE